MIKPEAQLAFLAKIQRLFAEGDFTATYKYALLIALADLSVELGNDDGEPLRIPHRSIGEKFIELYWQQATPFKDGLIIQNYGRQAAVISDILKFRHENPAETLLTARKLASFKRLLTKITTTVVVMPIDHLQNIGGSDEAFLYDRQKDFITLLPGVGFCLRRFQPLIQQLARNGWIEHVKGNKLNQPLLGQSDDLEGFLFEMPRQALTIIGHGLRRLGNGSCFYCGRVLKELDVDHFVPHSLYPRDLVHNFVAAHPACNRSKSNTLAAKAHLFNWMAFTEKHADDLSEIGLKAGVQYDHAAVKSVARWGYSNAIESHSHAWVKQKSYEPIDEGYLEILA